MPKEISEPAIEELGQLADQADNIVAMSLNSFVPPDVHISCMRGGLEEISAKIKSIVEDTTGHNPWK